MLGEELSDKTSPWLRLRQLLVPAWLWQFVWLRHLPEYYRSIDWKDCDRPGWKVLFDLLYIFFKLRLVPEHYGPCRLWTVPRKDWALYYGSPYTPLARARIARQVYPTEYEIVYNNKLVGAHLAKGLEVRQPTTLGTLEHHGAWRDQLNQFFDQSGQDRLLLKHMFGRGGIGIVLAERAEDGVVIRTRDSVVPVEQFDLAWPVFVQQLIHQDPRLAAIWNKSVNTTRVITLQTPGGEILILAAGIRFGQGDAFVDNWSAGGISFGVDHRTGRLRQRGFDKWGHVFTHHPDSGALLSGFQLPEWDRMLETARTVQRALPFSKLAGVDLALDHDGTPLLVEINGLPDLVPQEQLNGPLLADRRVLNAFADYDLLVSSAQRRLPTNVHEPVRSPEWLSTAAPPYVPEA